MTVTCCARARRRGARAWRVAAPSTLGTFLRAFTFGHVRQLDQRAGGTLERAWAAGAGPGDERLVIDVDSFVGEVYGYEKQGAGYGYTHKRGLSPDPRDPLRDRRGAAHPRPQGLGEHVSVARCGSSTS